MIKCLVSKFMYVGKPKTKTCLGQVLDIVQDCSNQDSRTVKLQKEEASYCEARPIENCVQQDLNQAQAHENVQGFSPTLLGIKGNP